MAPDKTRSKSGKTKSARLSGRPDPTKRVALSPMELPPMQRELRVRFHRTDVGGPWCLSAITPDDHIALLSQIAQWETMKVSQVFNGTIGKDEDVAGASPNPDARVRAEALNTEDVDLFSRLSMGPVRRLWGLRYENEFHVVWWDPNHEVWPSKLKNT